MNSRRLLWLLGILLISSESGHAQGKTSLFSSPITVSSGVENVLGPGGTLVPESSLLISPIHPLLVKDTARSNFSLSYSPELELVRNGTRKMTFWNHSADLAYSHAAGRRTKFALGHSFVLSSDPARLFADNLFVLPRNNFRENATAVTLRHDFSRDTTLGLRADNTITRISGPGRADNNTYLDQYGVAGTASLTLRVSEHQRLTGSYSLLKFSPYKFLSSTDASGFLVSIPTVRAGISRFGMTLALAAADAGTTPNGMMGGTTIGSPLPVTPAAPSASPDAGGTVASNVDSTGLIPRTRIFAADPEPTFSASSQNKTSLMGDPFHTVALTYGYELPTGLLFQATGGVMADNDVSYLFGTQVEKRYDRFWTSVGAHHFLSYYGLTPLQGDPGASTATLPPGTRARSEFSAATLTIGGKITRRTELEVSGVVSESKANFVFHHVRSLIGRARVNQWITDKFGIFATADFFNEDRNEVGATAFNRQRYFGGVQFRFSAPRRPTRLGEK